MDDWEGAPLEDDGESFGAELLDSSADVEDDGFVTVRGLDNAGCFAGLEFIGGSWWDRSFLGGDIRGGHYYPNGVRHD